MRSKPLPSKTTPGERVVKDIRRATRRHFSAEDKIRIVLDGLRGEDNCLKTSDDVHSSRQGGPHRRDTARQAACHRDSPCFRLYCRHAHKPLIAKFGN